MTLDKFTIKAQEAVQQAVNTAQINGQQVIEPVHILKGVMEKAKDVTNFIFQKLGVNAQQIELLVEQEIKHLPKVPGRWPRRSPPRCKWSWWTWSWSRNRRATSCGSTSKSRTASP